jgi:hypothetical protein
MSVLRDCVVTMNRKEEFMLNRLVANWVYGGFLAGVLLP